MASEKSNATRSDKASRVVFVGNISFDATEQQLIDVLQTVGPVVNFRLVSDRDTGKPKGYGFCEFLDAETAQSAIRNLNNLDFHGRSLRVGVADGAERMTAGSRRDARDSDSWSSASSSSSSSSASSSIDPRGSASSTSNATNATNASNASSAGKNRETKGSRRPDAASAIGRNAIPSSQEPPNSVESITNLIKQMSRGEMIEVLTEFKKFAGHNRQAANQLLVESPQLAQALLQMQILFGLVRPSDIHKLVSKHPPALIPQPPQLPPYGHGTPPGDPSPHAFYPPFVPPPMSHGLPGPVSYGVGGVGGVAVSHPQPPPPSVDYFPPISYGNHPTHNPQGPYGPPSTFQGPQEYLQAVQQMQQMQQMQQVQQHMVPMVPAPRNPFTPQVAQSMPGGVAELSIEQQIAKLPPDQQGLLREVLKLNPAEIAQLPPQVQNQIMKLKAQVGRI